MMLKKTVSALVLGLAFAAGANAANTTIDLGDVTFANTQEGFVFHTGSFTDQIRFELKQPALGEGQAFAYDSFLNNKLELSFSSASLYMVGSASPLASLMISPDKNFVFGGGTLAAGKYYFEISGTTTGTQGGKYGYSTSITPVPEPESYAMFLAGLGLIGAIARRRKQQAA